MKNKKALTFLVAVIAVASAISALFGLLSSGGPGSYQYDSIRDQTIVIYGSGIYKHMSLEVAIQGIAQDLITLLIAIPALIISFIYSLKGSLRARIIFTGVSFYFFVTYLMYQLMAMYNQLFLVYVFLAGASFFVLILNLYPLRSLEVKSVFSKNAKTTFGGAFLIFNGAAITLLWLSIVIPPLLDGSIYPLAVEHYTTLVVQAIDLSLLLPLAFLFGYLLYKQKPEGYLYGTAYLVFLVFMMTALLSKILFMGAYGYKIIPVIIIIPVILLCALIGSYGMLKGFKTG
ncbi:MAG: hypothetical protein U5K71_06310 [Gracilimonas sp.]|nr:hypothetical protein [Gracilimonas sp.]